ncbi:type II secretion system ATPase GspE [Hydrogenivirga sp. 128-5-R1-1]|uniref:type II secretion system ATPase GspE n=1 Tax=Hydrogenivirga sp. 128-5-R1-1 TaxID=392423 RepID=UPI00015EFD2C|nr:type II secretion system ATPase GspE [Hydrogenivirga sp. 128-5-R1-1]EDP74518.1 general secretion pathway protein E [Hydrogenivirga sp. 128-5-R1-1]
MNILKEYRLIPLEEQNGTLKLLVPKSFSEEEVEEIRFRTGKDVELVVLPDEEFAKELQERLSAEDIHIEGEEEETKEGLDLLQAQDDSPAVSLVNQVLIKASTVGASDVHFEPYEDEAVVRLRMDGVLHDVLKIPSSTYQNVVSRIKVMSNLNVAEKRVPQDGRIRVKIGSKDLDIRVSVVPTVFGERVVLRLLDKTGALLTLQQLGLSKEDREKVERLAKKPYGIVLVTGPTGAGKSTTLYAMLLYVKDPKKNIITIEDPVEYQIKGISQIQVNPKVGLTFASGLRSVLRQDPDIIMVGEIRDAETADIAVHAALTGHLVLSTLHTNDAPSAITRLSDMEIEPFLIASSLEGVIAQRLVRRICQHCKEPYKPDDEELKELGVEGYEGEFYRGRGCDQCLGTGYRGRIGVYEVLELDEDLKALITRTQDSNEIKKVAREKGYKTMLEDGIEKVKKGITTSSELLSVIRS